MGKDRAEFLKEQTSTVASNIREAAVRGDSSLEENIRWGKASMALNAQTKKDILEALRSDLYIEPGEASDIVQRAKDDEKDFVQALLDQLKKDPPLFQRADYVKRVLGKKTCSGFVSLFRDCLTDSGKKALRTEAEAKLTPALRKASQDTDLLVATKAKDLLKELDPSSKMRASKR